MKKIKSAVIDSIYINDISLLLKQEVIAIPDEIFRLSRDLQEAIKQNRVICDGLPHRGKIARLKEPRIAPVLSPQAETEDLSSINRRLSVLERSVGKLLKENYESVQDAKYDDYSLYMNAFNTLNYNAMIFDTFLDESKRHESDPGNAIVQNGLLTHKDNNRSYLFNSKEYEVDGVIDKVFPMARWTGEGKVQILINIGEQQTYVLDEKNNNLWHDHGPFDSNKISVTIALFSRHRNISLKSYGILIDFKENTDGTNIQERN